MYHVSTSEIIEVFNETIHDLSGTIRETVDDGSRLFIRALLPLVRPVQKGDPMQAGVALRASKSGIFVHPFLFREVCKNGQIASHCVQSRIVQTKDWMTFEVVRSMVQDAVVECSQPEVFEQNIDDIQAMMHERTDAGMMFLEVLQHVNALGNPGIARSILDQFFGAERTRFSLMNAITAVARDIHDDPETKWRLEELGGAVGAAIQPTPPTDVDAVELELNFQGSEHSPS